MKKNVCAILILLCALVFPLVLYGQETQPAQAQTQQQQPAPEAQPATPAGGDFENAMRLYRQRRFSSAVQEFEKVVQADPNNAAAFYFMGYAHYVMGHHQDALAAFSKAFQTNPNFDPRPHFQRQ